MSGMCRKASGPRATGLKMRSLDDKAILGAQEGAGVLHTRQLREPRPQQRPSPPCTLPQLVYMGFDTVVAEAALRVFRGNVQLAAQTLAHNGGSLPPDLQLAMEDSSTPSTSPSDSVSPSDSAGRSGASESPGS